jgi:hypothetical protein
VIGVAIVLCAYIIINTVVMFFNITGVGGFNGTAACSVAPNAPANGGASGGGASGAN